MTISPTAKARTTAVDTKYQDLRGGDTLLLPQKVALLGQGSSASTYSEDPAVYVSAADVGATYGFGSPLHLAALMLLPVNGDGLGTIELKVYPMVDDVGASPSIGDITPAGVATADGVFYVDVNGIISAPITVLTGDLAADLEARISDAINANLSMPITAVVGVGVVDVTAKHEGTSGDAISVVMVGPEDIGITFVVTSPTGGVANPDVGPTLAKIVDDWETMIVNCLETTDAAALDAYQSWGDGRWDALVKKPAIVFTGTTETDASTLTSLGNGRKTDRVNALVASTGGTSLPWQVAARGVARCALVADGNPPRDYAGQRMTGLVPGADQLQFAYPDRDALVKAGVSTSEVVDGVVVISDTVTFYHPDGEEPPAYSYVVDIVKLQSIIFNLDSIFSSEEWNGAPLIPDDQATTNPLAKRPKDAIAAANTMIDSLGLDAIISDPETAKNATSAEIDGNNPKRLNVAVTVQLSGNANVRSVNLFFGFLFG